MSGRGPLLVVVLALLLGGAAGLFVLLNQEAGPAPAPVEQLAPEAGPSLEPGPPRVQDPAPASGRSAGPERSAPQERRTAAQALGTRLRLEVTLGGQPAPAVQVLGGLADGPLQPQGQTGEDGRLTLRLDPGPWTLVLRAPLAGLVTRRVHLEPGDDQLLALALPAGISLEGRVRLVTGEAAGAGVRVLAWDVEQPDPAALLRHSRQGPRDPRLFEARSDGAGFFRLQGLVPQRSYRLAALGQDSLSDQALVVRAGARAELRLVPVQLHLVRPRSSRGSLPDPRLRVPGVQPRVSLPSGAKRLDLRTTPELWLTPAGAQLESALQGREAALGGPLGPLLVAAYGGPAPAAQGRTLRATVELVHPGFRRATVEVDLSPLGGSVPTSDLLLLPTSAEAPAGLRVDLELPPALRAALAADGRSPGRLRLRHGDGRLLELALPPVGELPALYGGLPKGRFGAGLLPAAGSLSGQSPELGAASVELVPGQVAELRLDLVQVSLLHVRLERPGGGAWGGGAILAVEPRSQGQRFVTLQRAPYLLLGAPPGPVTVRLNRLLGSSARGGAGEATITAGELSELTLTLGNE